MNATENFKSYIQNFNQDVKQNGGIGGDAEGTVSFGLTPNVPTVLVGITSKEGVKYDDNHKLVPSGR